MHAAFGVQSVSERPKGPLLDSINAAKSHLQSLPESLKPKGEKSPSVAKQRPTKHCRSPRSSTGFLMERSDESMILISRSSMSNSSLRFSLDSFFAPSCSSLRSFAAVECYTAFFTACTRYNSALNDAGLRRCCKEGEIRKVAEDEVERVFDGILIAPPTATSQE